MVCCARTRFACPRARTEPTEPHPQAPHSRAVVFAILMYQRWKYPVDNTRLNEFGQRGVELDDKKGEAGAGRSTRAPTGGIGARNLITAPVHTCLHLP